MTEVEREVLERDVIFDAEKSKRDYEIHKIKAAKVGERLEELGRALQSHPELVTPLPEVDAPDYRESLNLLTKRQEVIDLCEEVREFRNKAAVAAQRKAAIGW